MVPLARKRAGQIWPAALPGDGNVTALFGTLAKEAEPRQRFDEVVKERDALHSLFEQAPGFMALIEGRDHRYTFSNAANNRLLGRWDLVGKTVAEAFPELVEQGFVEKLDKVFLGGEPYIGSGVPIDVKAMPGSDGNRRIVNFIYQPIRLHPSGPVTGVFVEGHDVTELHDAQAAVQALQMELIHVSRVSAMATMASTVAHELNQPLAAATNYLAAASRIAGRLATDALLENCLASAKEAILRAGNILRLLRDLTLSGVDLSPAFEIRDAMEQAVELACASHPHISIAYDMVQGATAAVDRIQFQQVMLNLIRNAQEASEDGQCSLFIKVSLVGEFVEVSLTDNGRGFAVQDLPDVFETLLTSKPQGMGVGLPVCRTIVEKYGGRISACNSPDGGAVVKFTIPAGNPRPRST